MLQGAYAQNPSAWNPRSHKMPLAADSVRLSKMPVLMFVYKDLNISYTDLTAGVTTDVKYFGTLDIARDRCKFSVSDKDGKVLFEQADIMSGGKISFEKDATESDEHTSVYKIEIDPNRTCKFRIDADPTSSPFLYYGYPRVTFSYVITQNNKPEFVLLMNYIFK